MPEEYSSMSEIAETVESESSDTPETESQEAPVQEVESATPEMEAQEQPQQDQDPISKLEQLELDAQLKEELKKGYLRQADYTRKTQEIASLRKQAELYTQMQPIINKVFQDPALYRAALGITDPQAQPQEEQIPDDPKAYAEWVINRSVEKMRQEYEQREQQRQAEYQLEQDVTAAEQVDPRLQDPEFGQIVAGLVSQNQQFVNGEVSAVEATKQAIQAFDAFVKTRENNAKNDLVKRAQAKRALSTPTGSPASVGTGVPRTMSEALKMAQQELGS